MQITRLFFHPAHEGLFCSAADFTSFIKSHGLDVGEADGLTEVDYRAPLEAGQEVLGWRYQPEEVGDDDCRKTHHRFLNGETDTWMDWSPYTAPTLGDFLLWLDTRSPDRWDVGKVGPMRREDLEKIACKYSKNEAQSSKKGGTKR
jgi:hypothetical protein